VRETFLGREEGHVPIESLRIQNFRVFQDVTVTDLQPVSVFIGANGTGKSTLFDVFDFLKDCLKDNVRVALAKRGGFRDVVTLGHEDEAICIDVQVKLPLSEGERSLTYSLEIRIDRQAPVVKREALSSVGADGKIGYVVNFTDGSGWATHRQDGETKVEVFALDAPDILAIKGLGQFQRFEVASALRSVLEDWHISDLRVHASDGQYADEWSREQLGPRGENLAAVSKFFMESRRTRFDAVMEKMRRHVPGLSGATVNVTEDGRFLLRFQDGSFKEPFRKFVSDGTMALFAYLLLLEESKPRSLLGIDEPETYLYPSLMGELGEEFENYAARGGQVIIATHSPDLVNAISLPSLFVLTKQNGVSSVRRAADFENIPELVAAGDHLGWLWRQGLFRGVDP